jgi:hypothetical protein
MKSILFITLFSAITNVADFQKAINCPTICNNTLEPINEKNSLKFFLQSLVKAPFERVPYGNKNILKKFPPQWNLSGNKNTIQNKATQTIENNYNRIDSTFYAEMENRNKLVLEVNYKIAQKLFSSSFIRYDDSLKLHKKIRVKAVAFQFNNLFKTYSLIVNGKRRCYNCEYPIHQTENILINIDKQNNVIDKLIVSSVIGSDLGSSSKFFYIDENKIIHTKEFINDELTAGFKKYKQYKVTQDGHFVENAKNENTFVQ